MKEIMMASLKVLFLEKLAKDARLFLTLIIVTAMLQFLISYQRSLEDGFSLTFRMVVQRPPLHMAETITMAFLLYTNRMFSLRLGERFLFFTKPSRIDCLRKNI